MERGEEKDTETDRQTETQRQIDRERGGGWGVGRRPNRLCG